MRNEGELDANRSLSSSQDCLSIARFLDQMPTSCAVVGCSARCTRGAQPIGFSRFPADVDRRRLWLAALRRKNADWSAWSPSAYDHVCGAHFVTGRANNERRHPDYVPSLELGHSSSGSRQLKGESESAPTARAAGLSGAGDRVGVEEESTILRTPSLDRHARASKRAKLSHGCWQRSSECLVNNSS